MKKKSLKKLLALGLVSAMTAGMLAGCGSSETPATTPADGTEAAAKDDTAKADGEVPTLIW